VRKTSVFLTEINSSVDHGSIDESDDGGISNLAFAPASSIHTENEVNSINIQGRIGLD